MQRVDNFSVAVMPGGTCEEASPVFIWLVKKLFALLGVGRKKPMRQLYLTHVTDSSRETNIVSFYVEAEGAAYLLFAEFVACLREELARYPEALSGSDIREAPGHCTVRLMQPVQDYNVIERLTEAAARKMNMQLEHLGAITVTHAKQMLCEFGVYTALAH